MDAETSRVVQANARIYDTLQEKFGKIVSVSSDEVVVDFGTTKAPDIVEYDLTEFIDKVMADAIVGRYRTTLNSRDRVVVKPKQGVEGGVQQVLPIRTVIESKSPVATPIVAPEGNLVVDTTSKPQELSKGFIDVKSGKFSQEYRKGYIEIEYRPVTVEVKLQLTSDQIEKLQELGLI